MRTLLAIILLAACNTTPTPEGASEEALFNYCIDYKHCTSSAQCPSGQSCWSGDCRINPMATRCENWEYDPVHHYSIDVARNAAGDRQKCTPYACDYGTGSCRDRCVTSLDCSPGFSCADGWCQATLPACDDDGNCPALEFPPTLAIPPAVAPDVERAGMCSNACSERAGKSYEMCYHGYWLPKSTHCYDYDSALYWGYYYSSCGEYTCNAVRGYCNSSCGSAVDCSTGHYCGDDHVCH
jgi:hypothetical protein